MNTIEKEILDHIKKEPRAIGAFFFGSYARNPKGKHNDIDIQVIITENWRKRESIYIQKIHTEIFYAPVLQIKKELENELNKSRWFCNTKILFDSNNEIKELISYAHKITKEKLSKYDKEWWKYFIGDKLQDIDNETNTYQKIFLINSLFSDIIKVYFLANHLLPPKDNYSIKLIQKTNPKLYKLITNFFDSTNPAEKYKRLKEILTFLEEQIGTPQTTLTTKKQSLTKINHEK